MGRFLAGSSSNIDTEALERAVTKGLNIPRMLSPSNESVDVDLSPLFQLDGFGSAYAFDHQSTDIQLSTSVDFTTPFWEKLSQIGEMRYNIQYDGTPLALSTEYFVRFRFRDSEENETSWVVTSFTTIATDNSVVAPSIVSPTAASTDIYNRFTVSISDFAVNAGSDLRESFEFRIATDSGMTNIIFTSNPVTSRRGVLPDAPIIAPLTTYFVQARDKGVSYGYSTWGSITEFTTGSKTDLDWGQEVGLTSYPSVAADCIYALNDVLGLERLNNDRAIYLDNSSPTILRTLLVNRGTNSLSVSSSYSHSFQISSFCVPEENTVYFYDVNGDLFFLNFNGSSFDTAVDTGVNVVGGITYLWHSKGELWVIALGTSVPSSTWAATVYDISGGSALSSIASGSGSTPTVGGQLATVWGDTVDTRVGVSCRRDSFSWNAYFFEWTRAGSSVSLTATHSLNSGNTGNALTTPCKLTSAGYFFGKKTAYTSPVVSSHYHFAKDLKNSSRQYNIDSTISFSEDQAYLNMVCSLPSGDIVVLSPLSAHDQCGEYTRFSFVFNVDTGLTKGIRFAASGVSATVENWFKGAGTPLRSYLCALDEFTLVGVKSSTEISLWYIG